MSTGTPLPQGRLCHSGRYAVSPEGRSLPQIVEVLEGDGFRSKRGGRWHPQTVSRVLRRAV